MRNIFRGKTLGVALALAAVVGFTTEVRATQFAYSIVLPLVGEQRNQIYALNMSSGALTPYSTRLRDALDAAGAPPSVLVNSISLGLGTHDYVNFHGALLWSVAPGSQGIFPSDLFFEPTGDRRSDLYASPHTSASFFELNLKAAEENSANLPGPIEQLLASATLEIDGGVTGTPTVVGPPNLVGFDVRTAPSGGRIYFTVTESFVDNGTVFETSDILYAENGVIGKWRTAADLNLLIDDRIDAIDVDKVYHLFRNLDASVLFSVSADSPSVTQGTLDPAALYHHIENGSPNRTTHRTSLAAATVPGNSDIDSVVSIDPGDQFDSGEVDLIVTAAGEVEVATGPNVTDYVVYWNYELEPLDASGFTSSTLQLGDKVRIDVYAEVDGRWIGHHEVVAREGNSPNPALSLESSSVDGTSKFQFDPPQRRGAWELRIDGEPIFLPAAVGSWSTELEPGTYVVQLHYVPGPGRRSDALTILHEVPATLDTAIEVVATPLPANPSQYTFDWSPSTYGQEIVEVRMIGPTGTFEDNVAGAGWTSPDLLPGVHRFSFRHVSGDLASIPVVVSVLASPERFAHEVEAHLLLDPSNPLPGTTGDSAYLDGTGEVVTVDRSSTSGGYFIFSLLERKFTAATFPTGAGITAIHAVAAMPTPILFSANVQPQLIWAVTRNGALELVTSDEDGVLIAFDGLPTGIGAISGMTYDPVAHRLLVIIDAAVHEILLPVGGLGYGPIVPQPISSLAAINAVGITMVETGYYEVASAVDVDGTISHFSTFAGGTDALVTTIELDVPLTEVDGLVYTHHGAAGRPQYYVSTGEGLSEYFARDPRGVQPTP